MTSHAVANYIQFWSDICRASGGRVDPGPPARLHAPFDAPTIHGALGFEGPVDAADQEIGRWQAEGRPFSFSTVDPALAQHARRRGMRPMEHFQMVRAPATPYEADPRVKWTPDADAFTRLQAQVHDIPAAIEPHLAQAWGALADDGAVELATIRAADTVVACGAVYLTPDGPGLYAASVHPAHRRQGLAAALIRTAIGRCRELGHAEVVGATTEAGHALVRSLGFETVEDLYQMVWTPDSPPAPS